MNVEDMVLVSVDDHVVEPADLFEGRMPHRFTDRAPRFITKDDGTNRWVVEGEEVAQVALNAVAGRPQEELGLEPTGLDQIRPGTWDIHERMKDMDANGVLASMCFPTFPQFCGQLFSRLDDKELALAIIEAYNDWHIDGWCGAYPGRMIPLVVPPLWDPDVLAAEIRRTAKKGARAVTFSENTSTLGYPSIYSDHWDPFWKACSDENVIVCMHIGTSSELTITAPDAPVDTLITLTPLNIVKAAADLVWSPTLRKFPDVTVALSEGGIGWVPYFLERVDYIYDRHHLWTGASFPERRPSEVFLEQVITCFITDIAGMEAREHLNLDMLTWECDYPHADSMWPLSPESLPAHVRGLSDAEIDKVTHENAMRLFRFDPLAPNGGRDGCTVGALRARAAGHDVSERATGTRSGHQGARATDLLTTSGTVATVGAPKQAGA
jgi:predicted TIM-barrel fold metal-dependent hydrolase